jgi:D-beta-D-heptose 7-phosphate kinase/D-beta-D-heptose 1-phosphate adenosyltransferase
MMTSAAKIRSTEDALAWRAAQSGPVVFTNGVFDLLHAGHVHVLESARALGDVLLVAINSDASARRLGKGQERPIVGEADRARVVAALGCVDCVVLFDEDTPAELIESLSPDILVKGGDYAPDAIAGSAHVRSTGGRVVVIPLLPDRSTTRLVERLRVTP